MLTPSVPEGPKNHISNRHSLEVSGTIILPTVLSPTIQKYCTEKMKLPSICLLALGVQMLLAPLATANKLCFVIYQMADNDLEYFIRQDLAEYMQSSLMKNPDTISWVYFDNGDPEAEGTPDPLPDIFDTAGNPLENRTQDVYYLSYNHEFSEMQIVENLGELNSDTMSVVQDFATTAFRDCSEKGATEYMMAFSSHGAGFGGFGGDDVARRRRLGQLLDNGSISGALRSAIDSEIGVGAKLNVLGFDACLMSDYGALDDYSSITENFLASEDVEPGHGWSYAGLELDSAVNIATRIVDLFASDPQSEDGHQTPKTLAVVDTTAHMEFATKWEEFSRFLNIAFQEDENVQTAVKRARSKVLTFAGDTDDEGDKDEDMVDMMDFMNLFDGQCMPSGDLAIALMEAKNSYDAQFVTFKAGPSTDSRYTGMGVHFPSRKEFRANGLNFQVLESSRFATKTSPEWLDFLQTYYTSGTVFGSAGYCSSELATANPPQEEQGLLMVNPLVSGITNGAHDIETGVVKRVDSVFIEFGVELTAILGDGTRRRRLKETRSSRGSHSVPMGKNADSRFLKHEFNKQSRRLQGGSDDYLYMYGGELVGSFSGSVYSASWDRQFGVAGNSANDQHPIYVFSDGAAGKETPVFYFPADKPISIEDIFNMVEFEDATAAGGMAGYIKFSTDAGVVPTLYTTQGGDGDSYSETPATAGGQIVPIVYVDGMIDGFDYFYFIGGYDPVAFDWSTNSPLIIGTLPADDFLLSESGVLTLDLTAEDEDNGDSSYALFEIVDGVATKVNEGADAAMDTDAPSDGGTDSPVETGPPTAVAPTQAPGGGNTTDPPAGGGGQTDAPAGDPTNPPTAAPMVTDAPRGGTADSSATAASTLFSMALTLSVAHLTFA
ncbi:unnamed protein product [Cylindrotheca closterium]|uniref:Uncharacterized protein n=1 Tax=Cylindrotheca closterium TaxID=2856 RepID=A0AAD2CJH8_9STRA|nr:unnamed protein product [Cylindrotheca closterium]